MSLRIVEWQDFLESTVGEESAVTVGVFDGVHLGHRELIDRIVRRGPNPTVVTFRENPKKVVSPGSYEGDIFSLKQKLAIFEWLGVKRAVLIDFSEKFSKLRGCEFLDLLCGRGKMVFLAIGSNFRCGYGQDTDAALLREMNERKGIPTEVVPQVLLPEASGDEPVSSSRIRSAIMKGDLALASALMGRNVELDISDLWSADGGDMDSTHSMSDAVVYDFRSVRRIVPPSGRYAVRIHPGAVDGWVDTKNGKVFLPGKWSKGAESLEFQNSASPAGALRDFVPRESGRIAEPESGRSSGIH